MPWKAWKKNRLESRSGREKSKGSSGNWAVSCCHLDPFSAWCSLWVIRNGIQWCKPVRVPIGRLWHSKCAHSKDARETVSPLFLQPDCRRESWKGPSIYGSLMAVDRGAWQHGWHAGYLCSMCDVRLVHVGNTSTTRIYLKWSASRCPRFLEALQAAVNICCELLWWILMNYECIYIYIYEFMIINVLCFKLTYVPTYIQYNV